MWDRRTAALLEALRQGPGTFSSLRAIVGNARTLSRQLHQLVAAGWVAHAGRQYRLTERGARAGELFRGSERLNAPQVPPVAVDGIPHPMFARIVRWAVEELRDRLPQTLAGALVFGSVVRGQETSNSDVDLLLLIRGDARSVEEVRQGLLRVEHDLGSSPEYRAARSAGFHPVLDGHFLRLVGSARLHRLYLDGLTVGFPVFDREHHFVDLQRRMRDRLRDAGAVRVETPEGYRYWKLRDPELLGAPL